MQIQVNSNSSVAVGAEMIRSVEANVNNALDQFGDRITRVEVHLSDVNAEKGGAKDKNCLMEARPTSREPVIVSNQAETLEEAVAGAALKLQKRLSSLFGRLEDRT